MLRGVAAGVGEELRGVALINTNHLPHSCPNDTKLAYVSVPHRIALPTHEDEATRRGPGGVVVPGYLHIYTYLHISTHIYRGVPLVQQGVGGQPGASCEGEAGGPGVGGGGAVVATARHQSWPVIFYL